MTRNLWEYEDIVPELQKQGYEADEIVNAIDVLEHAGRADRRDHRTDGRVAEGGRVMRDPKADALVEVLDSFELDETDLADALYEAITRIAVNDLDRDRRCRELASQLLPADTDLLIWADPAERDNPIEGSTFVGRL